MLHLLGMTVLGDWWRGALVGQLLIAAFAPATAAMIAAAAMRWGSARAAWFAAIVYLTTPWVFRLAAFPFVEGPLCFFHAALVVAATACMARDGDADRAAAGRPLGAGAACWRAGRWRASIRAWSRRSCRSARWRSSRRSGGGRGRRCAAFAAGVAVGGRALAGPERRSTPGTRSIRWPSASSAGRDWDAALDAKWWAAHGPRPVDRPTPWPPAVLDVAGRSDWQSPLYRLARARWRWLRPGSRRLAAAMAGYVALPVRDLVPADAPARSLLAAAAAGGGGAGGAGGRLDGPPRSWRPGWRCSIGLVTVDEPAVHHSRRSAGPTDRTADLGRLRREVPARGQPAAREARRDLPPGARPLIVGQAASSYVGHPVVSNTVFDREDAGRDRRGPVARGDPPGAGATRDHARLCRLVGDRPAPEARRLRVLAVRHPGLFDRLVAAGSSGRRPAIGDRTGPLRGRRHGTGGSGAG